jgi:hypothetical protein
MKVLTANRLIDGVAVWLGANGEWLDYIDHALIARNDEAIAALEEIGRLSFARNFVVDVDLVDVEEVHGAIRPLRLRERIRAAGPTIRPDLGKQATRRAAAA